MPEPLLYFAYGSNLSREQMRSRCPESRFVRRAWLPGHRLAFSGYSKKWGGAVATIVVEVDYAVPGLVYELGARDLEALDGFEGYPRVYQRKLAVVHDDDARDLHVVTYYQVAETVRFGEPSERYRGVIEAAYREHDLETDPPAPLAAARRFSLATAARRKS